jgi:hypothetical protein
MARKSYGGKGKKTEGTPFEFDINGEEFVTRNKLPAMMMLQFADLATDDPTAETMDPAQIHRMVAMMNDTFEACFSKEDYARFQDAVKDPENEIDIEDLMTIFADLTEHFTTDLAGRARPTGDPSSDGSSSPSPGGDSRTGRSLTTTTYKRPVSVRRNSSRSLSSTSKT